MKVVRILLALTVVLGTSMAHASGPGLPPPTDCSSPRNAVESLFGWLQPESHRPEFAARCLSPEGRTPNELRAVASRVKAVFDARAMLVEVDELSEDPDFVDPTSKRARVIVHPGLPSVVVERQPDGRWLWTKGSLDAVEAVHARLFFARSEELIARIPQSLRGMVFGVELWQYIALLSVFFFGLVLRKTIQLVLANRLRPLVERFGQSWGAKLVAAIDSPGATLVMAGVLAIAYPQLRLPVQASLVMAVTVRVLATISLVWAAYRLADVFGEALMVRADRSKSRLDHQLVPLVRRSLKVITLVVGILFVLQNMDVDVGSLLAGLGIGGLAFALAARDTLANFFGSIMIFADRPFQIGDWVVIEGTEGIVEEVGFRSTRVRTFYNSLVTVPNSKIADSKIDNYGARKYRRTYTTLRLTYDTTPEQLQAFCEGVRAIMKANPYSRKDYYEIHVSGLGEWGIDVMLYIFFEVPNWSVELRERHNVYLEILRLAQDLKVRFAIPTQRMHHEFVAAPGATREVPMAPAPEQLGQVVLSYGPGGERARPEGPRIAGGMYADTAPPSQPAPTDAGLKKTG